MARKIETRLRTAADLQTTLASSPLNNHELGLSRLMTSSIGHSTQLSPINCDKEATPDALQSAFKPIRPFRLDDNTPD